MTARSALMQDEGASYLGLGSSQSKPINSWEERLSLHRLGYIAKDEASLFRGRQRSNFIIILHIPVPPKMPRTEKKVQIMP